MDLRKHVGGRSLEGEEVQEPGFQLEYILLISLLLCLFWYPCAKLVPRIWAKMVAILVLVGDCWTDARKKPELSEKVHPTSIPVKKAANHKGHISTKPAKMFFEDD
jgi:hypothetical protein